MPAERSGHRAAPPEIRARLVQAAATMCAASGADVKTVAGMAAALEAWVMETAHPPGAPGASASLRPAAKVERRFLAGETDAAIAEALGCSTETVRLRRYDLGLKRPSGAAWPARADSASGAHSSPVVFDDDREASQRPSPARHAGIYRPLRRPSSRGNGE